MASGAAIPSLIEDNSNPRYDRDEAKSLHWAHEKSVLGATMSELANGPSLPGHETQGLRELADLYHDALRDSIGPDRYTADVKDRFDILVKGGIMAGVRHTIEVAKGM